MCSKHFVVTTNDCSKQLHQQSISGGYIGNRINSNLEKEERPHNMCSKNYVATTNDSSSISKASMADRGYFNDPFLSKVIMKNFRRSPLINRGYFIRTWFVDRIVKQFLTQKFPTISNCAAVKQVVSLGAGFDTLYLRMRQCCPGDVDFVFVELDLPEVVEKKVKFLSDKLEGTEKVALETLQWPEFDRNSKSHCGAWRSLDGSLYLFSLDLRNLQSLSVCLLELNLGITVGSREGVTKAAKRMHHSVTELCNGEVLVFGGRLSPLKPCKDAVILKFSHSTELGLRKLSVEMTRRADEVLTEARWRHAACAVTMETKNGNDALTLVAITGGRTPTNVLSDAFLFNPKSLKVESQLPNLPQGLHSHALNFCAKRGWLLLSGGLDEDDCTSYALYYLQLFDRNMQWRRLEISSNILPRYSHVAMLVAHADALALFGGTHADHRSPQPQVGVVDLENCSAQEYLFPNSHVMNGS